MVEIYEGRSYPVPDTNLRIVIRKKIPLTDNYLVEFLDDPGTVWSMRWKPLKNRDIKQLLKLPRNQKLMIITK